MDGISTRMGNDGRPVIKLDTPTLVTFIPGDDDTYTTTSHYAMAVIETPEGVWLFSKQNS